MIEEKLEIVIPTYNRANFLDYTLNSLLNSPLKDCKITIRDNASPDNTPEICENYLKLFKNLHVIRNDKNIGGNANLLRSYENATYPYVWVLADNDKLNFDYCGELIDAIETEKYDLIICSSGWYVYHKNENPTFEDNGIYELIEEYRKNDENYLENNAQDLVEILKRYFFIITTFIPSSIYRTSIFDDETIMKAYDYILLSHPHYAFILKILDENALTYKTKHDLVMIQENPDDWEIQKFNWYKRYISCTTLINDKTIQKYAMQLYKQGFLYSSVTNIIIAKAHDEKFLKENIYEFIGTTLKLKGVFKGFFYSISFLLAYLIPKRICVYLFNKRMG